MYRSGLLFYGIEMNKMSFVVAIISTVSLSCAFITEQNLIEALRFKTLTEPAERTTQFTQMV